jgi:hypothetical protein
VWAALRLLADVVIFFADFCSPILVRRDDGAGAIGATDD